MLGFLQRKLIYHPFKAARIHVADAELAEGAIREIVVTAADGIELHGWHFVAGTPATNPQRPLVLYFPGNAANRLWRVAECGVLTAQGADVFLFDYRGFGDNAGSPSEEAIAADARTIWNDVVEKQGIVPERIVLYGESIGGGVAIRLAAELCAAGTPPGGVITRSTFSSLADTAAGHYPWLPVRWLLVEHYASVGRIGAVTCPILMLHGDADDIVPMRQGHELFAAAPEKSAAGFKNRFIELAGADHNNVLTTHNAEMHEAVRAFFAATGLVP
jgi:fermentation-respiration switch protein FrsA (DUF1100 family)